MSVDWASAPSLVAKNCWRPKPGNLEGLAGRTRQLQSSTEQLVVNCLLLEAGLDSFHKGRKPVVRGFAIKDGAEAQTTDVCPEPTPSGTSAARSHLAGASFLSL